MDRAKVNKMIEEICDWLENGAPGHGCEGKVYEGPVSFLARDYSRKLLKAANVETYGGCPLCQG